MDQVLQKGNFKSLPVNRGWRIYRSNRFLAKTMNIEWKDTAHAHPFRDDGSKSAATEYFRWSSYNAQPPQNGYLNFGYLDVTYYMAYRGLKYLGQD